MPQAITRHTGATALVDYVLDRPELLEAVRSLPAPALKRLIDHVGLEAAGEVVALLSSEQLAAVFDDDLWLSEEPGRDERFDVERFALWLQVLVEQDAALAARTLAELDLDLVTLALSRLLLVIDVDRLAQSMSAADPEDGEQLEKQLEAGLYHEFEEYRVISRGAPGWDALLAALLEWHERDYAGFARALERCCAISSEFIEDNGGLFEVLSAAEATEQDVAAARADRRAAAGYVAASDARAFLRLALENEPPRRADDYDAITRAYFRALGPARSGPAQGGARALAAEARQRGLAELLAALEVATGSQPASRALAAGDAQGAAPRLRAALRALAEPEPALHARRLEEAAYLANVLLAAMGPSHMRPVEAAEAALWLCELGADRALRARAARPERIAKLLREASLVALLHTGLRALLRARAAPTPLAALRAQLDAQGYATGSPGT